MHPEPLRTIEPGSNGLPVSLAVDSSGQIYVANAMSTNNNIVVYSSTANGQSTPVRLIQGTLTQINNLASLTVDATGNIYATAQANAGAGTAPGLLLMFAPSANGNVAPARVLTVTSGIFDGVAVDFGLNVYAVEEFPAGTNPAIVEFAAGAVGAATPIRSISGPVTDIGIPGGLRCDNAGNLFVTNALVTSSSISFSVLGFNSVASGNIPPTIQFSSTDWTAAAPELALQ
jgi:serine/threonine protein kinase, bacterial